MKILRNKKASKLLAYYSNNFGYKQPYHMLIDATFCQAALQNKVAVEDQLKKYLQCDLKCFTTQCIILEAESLGPMLQGATGIVKQFALYKCGHEGKPVTGANCIKDIIKKCHFIVTSQDRSLQHYLRQRPGHALLYLNRATPVLEAPSTKTKDAASRKIDTMLKENISVKVVKKQKEKEQIGSNQKPQFVTKKRKPKNPNPLSCKKKKTDKGIKQKGLKKVQ